MNITLRKIKKLLALAQDGAASENEAAIAATHVQRLLQEHGLSLAQIEAEGELLLDNDVTREQQIALQIVRHEYQEKLMAAIANTHFCLHQVREVPATEGMPAPCTQEEYDQIINAFNNNVDLMTLGMSAKLMVDVLNFQMESLKTQKRHVLVGRKINVDVTLLTFDYLENAMKRVVSMHNLSRSAVNIFIDGATSRLVERLYNRKQQAVAESKPLHANGTHRELTLVDVYGSEEDLNNDVLNGYSAGTTAARRREDARKYHEAKVRRQKLMEKGIDSDVAWYMAWGYEEQQARLTVANNRRADAPSRGRKRTGFTKADREYNRRVNSTAYKMGRAAADDISLDDQLNHQDRKRLS